MSRNGSGVYSKPAGTTAVTNTSISSADYNSTIDDIAADLNLARPVVAGGTGATTAAGALVNLGLTATAAELNLMDGVTASTAEINRLVGITAAGQALIDDADVAAQRTTLGLVIGTNVQAYDADLTALAGLSGVQGDIIYRDATQWQRLAKGAASAGLQMNSGATAPEWGLQKMPIPKTGSGVGQFLYQYGAASTAYVVPSGGTWEYFYIRRAVPGSTIVTSGGGIAAGGTNLFTTGGGEDALGWFRRFA